MVLAHGWGGRAAQMRAFVFPLLAAGFRVVAFDQPAHNRTATAEARLEDAAGRLYAHASSTCLVLAP